MAFIRKFLVLEEMATCKSVFGRLGLSQDSWKVCIERPVVQGSECFSID